MPSKIPYCVLKFKNDSHNDHPNCNLKKHKSKKEEISPNFNYAKLLLLPNCPFLSQIGEYQCLVETQNLPYLNRTGENLWLDFTSKIKKGNYKIIHHALIKNQPSGTFNCENDEKFLNKKITGTVLIDDKEQILTTSLLIFYDEERGFIYTFSKSVYKINA